MKKHGWRDLRISKSDGCVKRHVYMKAWLYGYEFMRSW